MSLVESVDGEEQKLTSIRELFRSFIDNRDYLGALGYYFSLGEENQV
ncbi:hypothetical protein J4429_00625 [Candidatus Pacearchaeota archaeon]|nr:hypothetical protein [Candidatus Pacearchaeota archaeon]